MSSLAGAVDFTATNGSIPETDVEMQPSDSAPIADAPEDEDMGDDLFGDDDVDEVKHERDDGILSPAERLPSPEREHRKAMEYAEDDEPDQDPVGQLEADVQIPNIPAPHSSDGQKWIMRTPNYVRIDSKPFHPDTYYGPEDEDQQAEVKQRSMSIKLAVENTIRWRWTKDEFGNERRQSNSRIIRWSDGTMSLKLGSELFDIKTVLDDSIAASRQSQSQSQTLSQPPSNAGNHGLSYLVAQHKRAEILQAEAVITGTMTLQPTDMSSETHRMLVKAVGQKHNKVARLRMADDPTRDPALELQEEIKRDRRPRRPREPRAEPRRRRARRGEDMWSDASEDEGPGSDEETPRARDAGGRRGGEYEADDFLVNDSDEEAGESDGGARPKKRSRRREEEQSEEDPLDKLDAQIEAAEEHKRKPPAKGGAEDEEGSERGEEPMDVESEEASDDDVKVRRARAGARKKRVAGYDDDDDE